MNASSRRYGVLSEQDRILHRVDMLAYGSANVRNSQYVLVLALELINRGDTGQRERVVRSSLYT